MTSQIVGEDQVQLYTLLNELSTVIDDKNDLGMIVGYSVVNALLNFHTRIGAKTRSEKVKKKLFNPSTIEQFHFEEVKSVYSELTESRVCVRDYDPSHCISDLISKVDPQMERTLHNSGIKKLESFLMRNIIANLNDNPLTYRDIFRRNGLSMTDLVLQKRIFNRPYDFLKQDYDSLQKCFVEKIVYKSI